MANEIGEKVTFCLQVLQNLQTSLHWWKRLATDSEGQQLCSNCRGLPFMTNSAACDMDDLGGSGRHVKRYDHPSIKALCPDQLCQSIPVYPVMQESKWTSDATCCWLFALLLLAAIHCPERSIAAFVKLSSRPEIATSLCISPAAVQRH